MNRLVRSPAWLWSSCLVLIGCGGGDTAADSANDVPADADHGEIPLDVGTADGVDDGAAPEDGLATEHAPDADDPDDTSVGEVVEDTGLDVEPGDASGEVCDPTGVGWDAPLAFSPAEFSELLAGGDRILLDVFDGEIPEIPGTDAQLPYTDVPAIEEYLDHDLCADLAIYCRRGVRSAEVGTTLAGRGYRFVRVLEGGVEAWQAAGYPVE